MLTNNRYADIKVNDIVDGEGLCVSFWTQGCPHRCKGCHNPDTWDFDVGKEFTEDTMKYIIDSISSFGVIRNFSILGGEPLCKENSKLVLDILKEVRHNYPAITVYLWTGYTKEYLENSKNDTIMEILSLINVLVDGPFILEQRDITLRFRGSSNQRIWIKDSNNNFILDPNQ